MGIEGGGRKVGSSGCLGPINLQGNTSAPVTRFNPAGFQPAGEDEKCRNISTLPREAEQYELK